MKREDLLLAVRRATEITRGNEVYVICSQAILGSFDESQLPAAATLSAEVDFVPLADDSDESLATLIDGQIGEWSEFHAANGFYIQGAGRRTAILPRGWRSRLVPISGADAPDAVGLCLEPHDLCVAKLVAHREKDIVFVTALIEAEIIDPTTLVSRIDLLDDVDVAEASKARARQWATYMERKAAGP